MISLRRESALASILWGGVAAVGQFSMLFLSIIGRIHVHFVNQAPVFTVDPRGPVTLTKDTALTAVWVLSVAYAAAVAMLVYFRPTLSRGMRIVLVVSFCAVALLAALAEPWWGLVLLGDLVALHPLLRSLPPARNKQDK